MGKGDKKSRKGKIWRHSYGVTRPRKVAVKTVAAKSAKKKSVKKAPAAKKEKTA